jgi:hypothetical protein
MSKKNWDDAAWDHEGQFDLEATIEDRRYFGDTEPTEYEAPGAKRKWKARNLLDIHWELTGIKVPSKSYLAIMSCIINHANPVNGVCMPRQTVLAIETGYSRDTVKRVVPWWERNGFLKTDSRGLAHALAYHPQWDLFEMHWIAVQDDIAASKGRLVTYACTTPRCIKGHHDEGHHGAPHNLKEGTTKLELNPERVHASRDTNNLSESHFSGEPLLPSEQVESQKASKKEPVERFGISNEEWRRLRGAK